MSVLSVCINDSTTALTDSILEALLIIGNPRQLTHLLNNSFISDTLRSLDLFLRLLLAVVICFEECEYAATFSNDEVDAEKSVEKQHGQHDRDYQLVVTVKVIQQGSFLARNDFVFGHRFGRLCLILLVGW